MKRKIFFAALLLWQLCLAGESSGQSKLTKESAGQVLRILTYNIHHANPPSKPDSIDLDAIARVITDSKADVVALQEVDAGTKRSGEGNQAKILAGKTGLHYQFFKAIDYDGGDYGIAILSRYKLKHTGIVRLPQQVVAEKRVLGYATIKAGKQKIIFANTHLDATKAPDNRIVQMQRILQVFEKAALPVILCGDLNSVPGSEAINLLDSQFKRTCTENCAHTVPQTEPRRTIDFIAGKNLPWALQEHRVIEEIYASDHRPVSAIFNIPLK